PCSELVCEQWGDPRFSVAPVLLSAWDYRSGINLDQVLRAQQPLAYASGGGREWHRQNLRAHASYLTIALQRRRRDVFNGLYQVLGTAAGRSDEAQDVLINVRRLSCHVARMDRLVSLRVEGRMARNE